MKKLSFVVLFTVATAFMVSSALAVNGTLCSIAEPISDPTDITVPPLSTGYITKIYHVTKPFTATATAYWSHTVTYSAHYLSPHPSASQTFPVGSTRYLTSKIVVTNLVSCNTITVIQQFINDQPDRDLMVEWVLDPICGPFIPTMGWVGMALLIAVLGLAGIFILRRRLDTGRTEA